MLIEMEGNRMELTSMLMWRLKHMCMHRSSSKTIYIFFLYVSMEPHTATKECNEQVVPQATLIS